MLECNNESLSELCMDTTSDCSEYCNFNKSFLDVLCLSSSEVLAFVTCEKYAVNSV